MAKKEKNQGAGLGNVLAGNHERIIIRLNYCGQYHAQKETRRCVRLRSNLHKEDPGLAASKLWREHSIVTPYWALCLNVLSPTDIVSQELLRFLIGQVSSRFYFVPSDSLQKTFTSMPSYLCSVEAVLTHQSKTQWVEIAWGYATGFFIHPKECQMLRW